MFPLHKTISSQLMSIIPQFFDHVGNMPGTYTITVVPSTLSATCKVQMGFINYISTQTRWHIPICLDQRDLNNEIIREHYKAPTLKEISHKLAGAIIFFNLDAKDWFWSIHLDTPSSFLTTFNTHKGRYRFLHMPLVLICCKIHKDQITDR